MGGKTSNPTQSSAVVLCSPGRIEVRDARAFRSENRERLSVFVDRIEAVPTVESVAINQQQGMAEIRFAVNSRLPELLRSLANTLRQMSKSFSAETSAAVSRKWQSSSELVTICKRSLNLTLAGVSFGISIVGVVVPGIPTVPFLLLTSYFLVRSSPSLNDRLLHSKTFGPLIHDWQRYRGMRMKAKLWIVAFVVVTIGITLLFSEPPGWLLAVMFMMGSISIVYILSVPTVPENGLTPSDPPANLAFNP